MPGARGVSRLRDTMSTALVVLMVTVAPVPLILVFPHSRFR